MKTLQEQLDYAHQEFTANEVYFGYIRDEVRIDFPIVEAEYYIKQMEMWLSIINSLTELITQDAIERDADLMDAKALLASERVRQPLNLAWIRGARKI